VTVATRLDERPANGLFREEDRSFLADVPAFGFAPRELDVEVAGHTVTIRGRKAGRVFGLELHLPAEADPNHLTASVSDGVLHLRTRPDPALGRRIPVKRGHGPLYAEAAGN
jgi:HSP20 family molecular chaperone IbpA